MQNTIWDELVVSTKQHKVAEEVCTERNVLQTSIKQASNSRSVQVSSRISSIFSWLFFSCGVLMFLKVVVSFPQYEFESTETTDISLLLSKHHCLKDVLSYPDVEKTIIIIVHLIHGNSNACSLWHLALTILVQHISASIHFVLHILSPCMEIASFCFPYCSSIFLFPVESIIHPAFYMGSIPFQTFLPYVLKIQLHISVRKLAQTLGHVIFFIYLCLVFLQTMKPWILSSGFLRPVLPGRRTEFERGLEFEQGLLCSGT